MSNALIGNTPLPTPKEEEQVQKFNVKDEAIAKVKGDKKWSVITEYFDERIAFYKEELAGADLRGKNLKEVGEKYLVCNMVATELEGIKAYVEQTARAVAEAKKPTSN